MTPQILLASQSPRRRELLNQIGVHHHATGVDVDETPRPGEAPAEYVIRLALEKATAGRCHAKNGMPVLAADTAVVIDNRILGKPANQQEAIEMLASLSGKVHKVLTGVALIGQHQASRLSVNRVYFRKITLEESISYWKSGEPADKAGGYAIQGLGALFIERLEGSYSGVMGLPLFEVTELLRREGINLLQI